MEVSYLLSGLVAFLGLLAGSIIAYMAKEELKPGRKYFLLMQRVLLLVITVLALNILQLQLLIRIVVYIIVITAVALNISSKLTYPLLAMALFAAKNSIITGLIFMYGLPTAAIIVQEKIKESRARTIAGIILSHISFVIMLLVTSFF